MRIENEIAGYDHSHLPFAIIHHTLKMSSSSKPTLITCGTYLYCTVNQNIIACHATNSSWNIWSIPKGLKDAGESSFDAALGRFERYF